MSNTLATLNAMCLAATQDVTHLSLHDGDPGTTGANELSGGDYERVARTYAEPEGGVADLTAPATFQVPAGAQPLYWGAWAGEVFKFGQPIADPPEEFGLDGQFTLASAPYIVENRPGEEAESA